MYAVSLFSGVGGFEQGFDRAGIQTILQVEQDPWCLEVLRRHYPHTPKLGDVRDLREEHATTLRRRAADLERGINHPDLEYVRDGGIKERNIDLVHGGFPCQDVSVAGRRAGLAGERSGLWFEFRRILSLLQPRWAVIENTPGLLSSHHGEDFRTILQGLDELRYSVSWAVLDAQFFGVPQRRRRLYLVAGPTGRATEQVLALCPCCGGYADPSRHPAEVPARDAVGYLDGDDGHVGGVPRIARSLTTRTRYDAEEETFVSTSGTWLRRLTPLERDRCMGWPDHWTALTHDGKPVPETSRIKMTGNGVCSPVAAWIGHRLVKVDSFTR